MADEWLAARRLRRAIERIGDEDATTEESRTAVARLASHLRDEETLLVENAQLEAELVALEERRDRLRTRLDEAVGLVKGVAGRREAERARAEAEAARAEDVAGRLGRFWQNMLDQAEEKERELDQFVAEMEPEALRRSDEELSAELVRWGERRVRAEGDLLGLLRRLEGGEGPATAPKRKRSEGTP